MSDVFISHVEEDQSLADEIAHALEAGGYSTWLYEHDSVPGVSYLLQVLQAIEESTAVVLVISADTLHSAQVNAEIVHAHERGKHLLPVLRGLAHADLQRLRPDWAMIVGAATSITLPPEGVSSVVPRIIEGLRRLGIRPGGPAPAPASPAPPPAARVPPLPVTAPPGASIPPAVPGGSAPPPLAAPGPGRPPALAIALPALGLLAAAALLLLVLGRFPGGQLTGGAPSPPPSPPGSTRVPAAVALSTASPPALAATAPSTARPAATTTPGTPTAAAQLALAPTPLPSPAAAGATSEPTAATRAAATTGAAADAVTTAAPDAGLRLLFHTSLDDVRAIQSPLVGVGGITSLEPSRFVAGRVGNAVDMAGPRRYIRFPVVRGQQRNLELDQGELELWYRPAQDATDTSEEQTLFLMGASDGAPRIHLRHREWLALSVTTPDWSDLTVSSPSGVPLWQAGQWVRIRAVWDRGAADDSLQLYVNDLRVDNAGAAGGWSLGEEQATQGFFIGAADMIGQMPAAGLIDEVRIWTRLPPDRPPRTPAAS